MRAFGDLAAGLSFEQGPPLAIPATFFLTAPLALLAAGCVLVVQGELPWLSPWMPSAVALTHLFTLGFLSTVMWGALYQMLPVLAGSPVPAVRGAHFVHLALVVGMVAFAGGLLFGQAPWLWAAMVLLVPALLGFFVPVGLALARAPKPDPTLVGMMLALASLVLAAVLAVLMLWLYAAVLPWELRRERLVAHLCLAGLVWVGGLLISVSWQIVPMFYLSPPYGARLKKTSLLLIGASMLAISGTLLGRCSHLWVLAAAGPAAVAVWLVHPLQTLRLLGQRRRKRVDDSIHCWRLGLLIALLLIPLALAAALLPNSRLATLVVWLAGWGWAGLIIHGMLSRIVPFLVWFHRFAPLAGRLPIPTTKQLLPRSHLRLALGLHIAALLCGSAGILSSQALLARFTGLLLMLTGGAMLSWLVRVLLRRPAV